MRHAPLTILLLSCGRPPVEPVDSARPEPIDDCFITVTETDPVDGATDVYVRDIVTFTLEDSDPTGTILAPVPFRPP